ncbi:MAG: hypothetical protein U1E45_04660 [Geminicoccaceae bacterium]
MSVLPLHASELESIYARTLGAGVRSLAITAPKVGSGTTTLALALSRRASAAGRRVLLVEFNSSRPSLATVLDVQTRDWALHDGTAANAMVPVPGGSLAVLPASMRGALSIESREPKVIQAAFQHWTETYDCVVADMPPVDLPGQVALPAPSLCAAAEGTLLVVLAGATTATELAAAARTLAAANARVLGCVVNDRFNPTLAQELARETHRLDRFLPRLSRAIRDKLSRIELFSLRS